jgi:hypothetical protein
MLVSPSVGSISGRGNRTRIKDVKTKEMEGEGKKCDEKMKGGREDYEVLR